MSLPRQALTTTKLLWSSIRHVSRGLMDLTFPPLCLVCDTPMAEDGDFCANCLREVLPPATPTCCRCAARVGPFIDTTSGCPQCRGRQFAFSHVVRLGAYEGVMRQAVLRIKYQPDVTLATVLARRWYAARQEHWQQCPAAAVVPVPLHWLRRWQRGCNQAEVLATALAAAWGKPCGRGWLWRRRWTSAQAARPPAERWENMRDAFAARLPPVWKQKALLLVDDVLTTGATAHAAAAALKKAGAGDVWVAVLARSDRA